MKQSYLFVESLELETVRVSDIVSLNPKSAGNEGAYRELIGLPATLAASVSTAVCTSSVVSKSPPLI